MQPPERTDRSRFGDALLTLDVAPPAGDPANSSAADDADRRRFPRRDGRSMVQVLPLAGRAPVDPASVDWLLHSAGLKGRLIDVSLNGIAFVVDESIEEGEKVFLRLSNPQLREAIDAQAVVVRTITDEGGRYKVVCRLDRPLEFEQIRHFGRETFASKLV